MAYETKVIISLLADSIGRAKTPKEAYNILMRAANIEGVTLPSYEEFQKQIDAENEEK